jgi:hypothetical protein
MISYPGKITSKLHKELFYTKELLTIIIRKVLIEQISTSNISKLELYALANFELIP